VCGGGGGGGGGGVIQQSTFDLIDSIALIKEKKEKVGPKPGLN